MLARIHIGGAGPYNWNMRCALPLSLLLLACTPPPSPMAPPREGPAPSPSADPTPAPAAGPVGADGQWVPLTSSFLAHRVAIAGHTACAVSRGGELACWGKHIGQRRGEPESAGTATPQHWTGAGEALDVVVTSSQVCTLHEGGDVRCISIQNVYETPPTVHRLDAVAIAAAHDVVCAKPQAGDVRCWGPVANGVFETSPEEAGRHTEIPIADTADLTAVTCHGRRCCGLRDDALLCWGDLRRFGYEEGLQCPTEILRADGAQRVHVEPEAACAITADHHWRCAGAEHALDRIPRRGLATSGTSPDRVVVSVDGTLSAEGGLRHQHVAQLATSSGNGCAVTEEAAVVCWGRNEHGVLGDGGTIVHRTPRRIDLDAKLTAINAGSSTACALDGDLHIRCWGELDPSTTAAPQRRRDNVSALAESQYFSQAGIVDGRVFLDLVGRHTFDDPNDPIRVTAVGLDRARTLCAASAPGVQCRFGLGDGRIDDTWRLVPGSRTVVELSPRSTGWCGRRRDGGVVCVKDRRFDDDPDFVDAPAEVPAAKPVAGITGAVELASGQDHTCAREKSGEVRCWGTMGFAHDWSWRDPTPIPAFEGATSIAARHFHTCAVVDGRVLCFGDNERGQLGDGTLEPRIHPVPARLPAGVRAATVSVADGVTCALDTDGHAWCWGDNQRGLVGDRRTMVADDEAVRVVRMGPR